MNITLETDYAIRIVVFLARIAKRVDASKIAEETGVSLRFSLKILRKLVGADILCSFKGVNGGYQIKKDPAVISLKEIIYVIEGDYALSRCLLGTAVCSRPKQKNSPRCKVQKVFAEISAMVNKKLADTTVDQLL